MSDDKPDTPDDISLVDNAEEEDDVEYEYVYEDENGNPIAAPSGDLDSSHFEEEVIEVIEQEDGQEQPVSPTAVTVNIQVEGSETRPVRSGSTRRLSDRRASRRGNRQSGRLSSRQMNPSQAKYAKLKTLLMVGSLLMIPILIVAILAMCWYKGYWPFSPRERREIVVQNDYDRGRGMASKAWRAFARARKTLEGKDDQYYSVLQQCETNYSRGIALMQGWREAHKDPGYWTVDERIRDANVKLREIREQKFKIEMRRDMPK
jgi:hypothetical protein